MSGGVDSAVTAALLLREGHEVGGAVMRLHDASADEVENAERSAKHLGIPFYVFSWQKEFRELVQKPFMQVYQSGGTPNPCIFCNKTVKFGLFLEKALELGFDKIATGHYARIEQNADGRFLVKTASDPRKDQTYMFYTLSQQQLSRIVLPMADKTKEDARRLAAELGLPVAERHDSQDICFIPDGDYMRFLTENGMRPVPGHFIGPDGRDYGEHRGMQAYTIGQRRGLDVAYGSRIYVTAKNEKDVFIGPNEALFSTRVRIGNVNYIPFDAPGGSFRCQAKLRYTPKTAACTVYPAAEGAELVFDEPQRAVTPGQSAVLYDGELLLGGGIIVG